VGTSDKNGVLVSNPVWIFTTIGAFCDMFLVATLMGYGMKYIQEQYSISAGLAGLCGGRVKNSSVKGVL